VMRVPADNPRVLLMAEFPDSKRLAEPEQSWKPVLSSDQNGYRVRMYRT
jgi:hypothetical protein